MLKLETIRPIIAQVIAEEGLPPEFALSAERYFVPLCDHIVKCCRALSRPLIVGINGAQGTGKSTLALLLKRLLLTQQHTSVIISIDDLYLTRDERTRLAESVHPLLQTRGVPGTHDLPMGLKIVEELKNAQADSRIPIPHFDKARDDRSPAHRWNVQMGPVDVILIEGWCVGARPISLAGKPINALEQQHDVEGVWRNYVEKQLLAYQQLFSQFDLLVMLKAPSIECVVEWRNLQEQKLRQRLAQVTADTQADQNQHIMDESQLHWFIMHYERLTRSMLEHMPEYADVVYELNAQHRVVAEHYRAQNQLGSGTH